MITKRTKAIAIFSCALLVLSISSFGVVSYFVRHTQESFVVRQEEVLTVRSNTQELLALERLVNESVGEREELTTYILQDENVIDFLSFVERLGNEHGVVFTTEALDVRSAEQDFEELFMRVSVIGTYDSVKHMLRLLETLPQQSYISDVSINDLGGVEGSDTWQGSFSLHITKEKSI